MKIVIAPDSFKGTATAAQAAGWLGEGVRAVAPEADIVLVPMAHGGEGTSECFAGERVALPTTTADGRLTEATYTFDTDTAYIDVATASGLPLVSQPCALDGDTYGTGVLIADAVERGARRIVLGLGGSATVDGGTGILVALGTQLLDPEGRAVPQGGAGLERVATLDAATLNVKAAAVDWLLLADVTTPPAEAAQVFGPQKGAGAQDVERLRRGLTHLCEVAGVSADRASFGAAGAIPVGIAWLSSLVHGSEEHVQILPGAATVARANGLAEQAADADLVITGEGAYDAQSQMGKVVSVVTALGRPTAIAAGSIEGEFPGLTAELPNLPVDEQLRRAGAEIIRQYLQQH